MGFFARLRGTFIKNESIQDELEFHIEQRTEELTADGLTKEEAHRQARHELGNPSKWRDETRDADVFITLEDWLRDTRQSLRGLRQRPVFAATAIGSLAIGIGAIASLFAIADAVIWKPIALPGERELYHLQEFVRGQFRGSNGPRLKDWQSLSSVAGATGTYGEPLVWRGPNGNEQVRCLRTYTGLNATIRPTIALGRAFTSEEEAGEPVALATHAFWRDRLNSAASVGGHAIVLSGKSYRIVGVLDTSIGYPEDVDLWVPAPAFYHNGPRVASYLDVIMRLKPGVLRSHAQAELTLAALRLGQAYPKTDAGLGANIVPLREQLGRSGRRLLFLLLAIAACVLAMVCVNIAALLLSRGAERERESGLRTALGASPGSLVRLYMIESGLIAVAGGAIGVLLAIGAVDALKRILPGDLARLSDALVDSRVVAFTFVVSLLAALASGLAPAWIAVSSTALHEGARGVSVRSRNNRLRTAFVIAEITLSVFLVATALRLAQSFAEVASSPRTFQIDHVLAVEVPFPWSDDNSRLPNLTAQMLERFSALPGVTQAGVVDQYPLLGSTQTPVVRVEGIVTADPIHAGLRVASPSYFEAMEVRLLAGRLFSSRKPAEYVVNEAFAKRYFTDGRAAAQHRVAFGKSEKWFEIVGAVADLPQDPARREAEPELFTHYANDFWPLLRFVLRTGASASSLAPLIRQQVAELDSTVLVKSVTPMREKIGESEKDSRVRSGLVAACAGFALLRMAIGVHGLIAGDVATRWREFGVRLALGATIPSLRALLIQKIAVLAVLGLAAGMAIVLMTSNLLAHSFEGLPPVRIVTLAVVCAAIALAALTAVLWPLYRIARIDPATALRHE